MKTIAIMIKECPIKKKIIASGFLLVFKISYWGIITEIRNLVEMKMITECEGWWISFSSKPWLVVPRPPDKWPFFAVGALWAFLIELLSMSSAFIHLSPLRTGKDLLLALGLGTDSASLRFPHFCRLAQQALSAHAFEENALEKSLIHTSLNRPPKSSDTVFVGKCFSAVRWKCVSVWITRTNEKIEKVHWRSKRRESIYECMET